MDIKKMMTTKDIQRFENKFLKTDGCWEWKGKPSCYGYGRFRPHGAIGSVHNAHRVSYELYRGRLKKGHEPDHLCKNKICVRPDHLESVTKSVNAKRAATKNVCSRGHEYTPENTYICPRGWKQCVKCYALRNKGFQLKPNSPRWSRK